MSWLDNWVVACLVPLAVWMVASGLDDLTLDLVCLFQWLRGWVAGRGQRRWPGRQEPESAPEKRIAIFVPLWREDQVIGRMLEHNLAAIHYRDYEVFLGAYPNDPATLAAANEARRRSARVRLVMCPHDGPTSKADCLNWIYQGMLIEEERRGIRFEVVVLHDAEDLIHPESLRWINWLTDHYEMVQIPVLPLPTPLRKLTHGVYCDEFAEFQSRDLPARQALGGFIPSCGVGAGYARRALEKLARTAANCVFDPGCLTEDYDVGLRLHRLGCRQVFVPLRFLNGKPLATRELFPERFRNALRQRTRWALGIVFQSWEKHGWGLRQWYWLWRDRKGLVGIPASCLANLLFFYGLGTWLGSGLRAEPWPLARVAAEVAASWVFGATLFLLLLRSGVRIGCVARAYGWRFALAAPLRVVWANWLNCFATFSALRSYLHARLSRRPLVWLKTEHRYPSRAALMCYKRRLGEILVGSGCLEPEQLEAALSSQPPQVLLGAHLVRLRVLSEEALYEALSLQHNLPLARLGSAQIHESAARVVPAELARRWRVAPFRVERGELHVASADLPTEEQERELHAVTGLRIRFHLITPSNLGLLERQLR